ncbi:MAG: hypothetical protein ACJAS1_006038 [Oleiphilaceae bacterium]|jgi:hypothetical protein
MNKGEWYNFLFERVDTAIDEEYFFEAAFICYGVIEDRLTSLLELSGVRVPQGVGRKIGDLAKSQSHASEVLLQFDNWDSTKGQYNKHGKLSEILPWGELYRNPLQHKLGDPRVYKAKFGGFHSENTKDMAIEGRRIARELSTLLMQFKKQYKNFP